MTTETIYEGTGGCGRFQICHATLTQLTRFAAAWTLNLMMFGIYEPPWKCIRTDPNDMNSIGVGPAAAGCEDDSCLPVSLFTNSSKRGIHTPGVNETILVSLLLNESNILIYESTSKNSSTTGTDARCASSFLNDCDAITFDPSSKTIVSEFGLICDRSFVPSIIICVQMIGMLVGAYVGGQLGEWRGRKVSLYSSVALCALSTFLAIFSPSWQVYTGFMFFNGAGAGGIMGTSIVYSMEFLEPNWRGRLIGMPVFSAALTLFAVTISILRNWVYVHIATALVCVLTIFGAFWVPESLRWLSVHGKEKKAERVVQKIVRVNNKVDVEIADVMEKLATVKVNADQSCAKKYTYSDLFRTSQIRSVTIKASIICFSEILSYYALSFSVKSWAGDFYTNAIVASILEIPFLLFITVVINKFGRRLTLTMYTSLATLGFLIVVIAHYAAFANVSEHVITYCAIVSKASAIACINGFYVIQVEMFPTAVRNLGMAFSCTVGRVGAVLAPYLIPRDQDSLIISYIILGVCSLLSIGVILSLPETKGIALQDKLNDVQDELEVNDSESNVDS